MEYITISNFNNKNLVVRFCHAPQEWEMSPEDVVDELFVGKKYHRWNTLDFTRLKRDNPQIPKKELETLSTELTLNEILGPEKYEEVIKSVASTRPELSKVEAQSMYILLDLLKKNPEYLMSYIYENGIFPGLLFKKRNLSQPNGLALFNDSIKQNPRWSIELATATLSKVEKYPSILSSKLDDWLFYQLKDINFARQTKNKEFTEALASYLRYCSKDCHKVCSLICSKMDAFCERDQCLLWDQILCQNTSFSKQQAVILAFLENDHLASTNVNFCRYIHANIPTSKFEEILGHGSDIAQKRYLKILKEQKKERADVCIQKDGTRRFLYWDLLKKGKIPEVEILELIQAYDPQKRLHPAKNSFLFQDKKQLSWKIFESGCYKFKNSPLNALMWINSFSQLEGFDSLLALTWENLPPQIRQNPNVQLTMDNRFDLLYQLACRGNTSMMNEIIRTMKDKYPEFIKRLIRPHNDGDTCVHQLCRQGKKGLLKILEFLPKEEQNVLLNKKDNQGRTPLDVCSNDFRRFLDQKNFIRPTLPVQKIDISVQKESKVAPEKQATKIEKVSKKLIWRPRFKSKRYNDDCKKFANQRNVIKGAWREIAKLRSMPWAELQLRMGQDIKRNLKSRLCAADFYADGNAYRIGYILQDGVIGLLFIMTHQQYNKELQIGGPVDTMALGMRKHISAQAVAKRNSGRQ